MKIVAFIPIKQDSQRLVGKNFLPLGDKPLYRWVFDTLDGLLETYAFTNCQLELPDSIKLLQRPLCLDSDETNGIDIYKAFSEIVVADAYVLIHCTSPFLRRETIQRAIDLLQTYDSVFTVRKYQTFGWQGDKPLYSGIPRTQTMEPIYLETSALYGFSSSLLSQGLRIGGKSCKIITDAVESLDIDELEDYELAKVYLNV